MAENEIANDLDPNDVVVDADEVDPDPEIVTDPDDPNWVEPAAGVPSRRKQGDS